MNLLSRGSWAVALALVLGTGAAAARPQPPSDEALRAEARPGLERLMDGDLEGAIRVFREIQKADAQSPLGDLLEADALWWRIYYSTANLVDPDVFITTDHPASPHDAARLAPSAMAINTIKIKRCRCRMGLVILLAPVLPS